MTRRRVRVHPDLFLQIEAQLPQERGPNGEPTVAEFVASDLLDIVAAFESLWDELPPHIRGRRDYRQLLTMTRLAPGVVVRGQLSPRDGVVELVEIEIDLVGPLPAPDEDDPEE